MNTLIDRIKNSWRSLTIWFNSALLLVSAFIPELLSTLPALREHLGHDLYRWVALLAIVGNMLLRIKTTQDLASKGK